MKKFSVIIKSGETIPVPDQWVIEWCKVYPAGMVEGCLRDAAVWSLDNPSKRKTKRGLRKFLGGWIMREFKRRQGESSWGDVDFDSGKYERRN